MDKPLTQSEESFKTLLDGGVKNAYTRPWHRIERGLRLNRLRKYIDDIATTYQMLDGEKEELFVFFQSNNLPKLRNHWLST